MTRADRVYLSIVAWPAACDDALRMDVFQNLLGADLFRAKEWMRRPLPAVFIRDDEAHAADLLARLQDRGVVARAVPLLSIEGRLQPPIAKGLRRSGDGPRYTFDSGRGAEATVDAKSIALIVRSHVRDHAGHPEGDFGVQALHHLQGTFSAEDWSQAHTGRRRLRVDEVADIHSTEGPHWRVIAGRCTMIGVPDADLETGRDTLDRLARQIARDNPAVRIDQRFEHSLFLSEIVPDFGVAGDWRSLAGFSVYSAWLRELEDAGVLT